MRCGGIGSFRAEASDGPDYVDGAASTGFTRASESTDDPDFDCSGTFRAATSESAYFANPTSPLVLPLDVVVPSGRQLLKVPRLGECHCGEVDKVTHKKKIGWHLPLVSKGGLTP